MTNVPSQLSFFYLLVGFIILCICASCDSGNSGSIEKSIADDEITEVEISSDLSDDSSTPIADIDSTNPNRATWQKPEQIIESMGDLTGLTIADLGAGSGYFAFRLAFKADRVIALDIDPEMIALMESFKTNLPEKIRSKFETRKVSESNAMLEEGEVDLILIVNTIAYIDDRVSYLKSLIPALKPGGRVMILDFKMQRLPIEDAPSKSDRVYIDVIEEELILSGFEEVVTDDTTLDFQYIVKAHR